MIKKRQKPEELADELEGGEFDGEPIELANDGPTVEYDQEFVLQFEASPRDVEVTDRALYEVSGAVAPGAPRPIDLIARIATEGLWLFMRMRGAANETGSAGLASAVPPYATIMYEIARGRAGYGPDEVVLDDLGEFSEAGFYAVIIHGPCTQVVIRLRETGLKPPLGVLEMTRHGFRPDEIVRSQFAHLFTPQWWLRWFERQLVGNDN